MQVKQLVATLTVGLFACAAAADARWETDFEDAKKTAAATHRYLLLDFSGSDWCGWCIKLDKEVFSQKEFGNYAEQNLVCVLLDFPQGKTLSKKLVEQNEQLQQQYGVRGYPTVLLLAPDGSTVVQTGYRKGGAEPYVSYLNEQITAHRAQNNVPAPVAEAPKHGAAKRPALRAPGKSLALDTTREVRGWTTKNGATMTAALLQEKGPYVVLRQADGKDVQVARNSLSAADQEYILALKEPAAAAPSSVE